MANFTYSAGGSATRVPTLHSEEEAKEEEREAREGSKEGDDQAQSRSNRWKAKHEAMLKQAGEEAKAGSQQVFESSSLVITLNETTRREEGESEGLRLKAAGSLEAQDPSRVARRGMKTVLAV